MMKIKELYEKIRDGIIVSDIDLQREIIYNTEKQQLVIDSILNQVPLPAFYHRSRLLMRLPPLMQLLPALSFCPHQLNASRSDTDQRHDQFQSLSAS